MTNEDVTVREAQREVRAVFLSGSVGQFVSGVVWIGSALAATLASPSAGIIVLVIGGFFIFPATQALIRASGYPASLSSGNPLNALALQVAFIVPLLLPLAGAAALHRLNWFYPAVMCIVGAHYLPFVFLYGMRAFGALGAALLIVGMALGFIPQPRFATGAWITGSILIAFGGWARSAWRREFRSAPAHPVYKG